jgi:hypothetical protein
MLRDNVDIHADEHRSRSRKVMKALPAILTAAITVTGCAVTPRSGSQEAWDDAPQFVRSEWCSTYWLSTEPEAAANVRIGAGLSVEEAAEMVDMLANNC